MGGFTVMRESRLTLAGLDGADVCRREVIATGMLLLAPAIIAASPAPDARLRAFLLKALDEPDRAQRKALAVRTIGATPADPATADVPALLLAVGAIGMAARLSSLNESVSRGYARTGRTMIDALLRRAPAVAWSWALDGMWHVEAIRRGGMLARTFLGADLTRGIASLDRATAAAPADTALALAAAVTLLSHDPDRQRARAERLLAAAANPGADAPAGASAVAALASDLRRALASSPAGAKSMSINIF